MKRHPQSKPSSHGPRTIQLMAHQRRLLIQCQGSGNLLLPKLALSTVHWASALAEQFFQRQRRCLALVFLLDWPLQHWIPVLPTQRCGLERAIWQLRARDFARLSPHLLIAGSFQSALAKDFFQASKLIPAFDGLHVVGHVTNQRLWAFIRCQSQVSLAEPNAILSDDLEATLRRQAQRLRIR